ncbi:MAG: hypothetical protein RTV31_15720 [Candidatus Thorarchaeota archaeon]
MDDEMHVPDVGSLTSGEIFVGLLIIIAVFSSINSLGLSLADPSSAIATTSIVFGLAAVAVAILSVGRSISESK